MQVFHIATPEVTTTAELIAHLRAGGNHDIANNLLIGTGSLELRSDQDYHYSEQSPSVSELQKELAFIREHMVALKTWPEKVTPECSDAVIRALYNLACDALDQRVNV